MLDGDLGAVLGGGATPSASPMHDAPLVRHQGGGGGSIGPTDHQIPRGGGGNDNLVPGELVATAARLDGRRGHRQDDTEEDRHSGSEFEEGPVRVLTPP